MFTKEQLAKWRAAGFVFDSFYDKVAVDKKKDDITILSITIVPKQAKESRSQLFTVTIQLTGTLTTEKLNVEIDGKIFQAYQKVNLFGQDIGGISYYADVSVDIPAPYAEKTFKITANLVDVSNNKILKSKSINISVNEDGEIKETISQEENISSNVVVYHIYWKDGKIEKHIPKGIDESINNSIKYIYHDENNKEHDLGDFTKKTIKNIYGSIYGGKTIDLVDIRELKNYLSDTVYFRLSLNPATNRFFMNTKTLASLVGGMLECSYNDFVFNGFSNEKGESIGGSKSHKNGQNGDLRYLRLDMSGRRMDLRNSEETGDPCGWKGLDELRQNNFNDSLYKFGWKKLLSWEYNNGKILDHCTNWDRHWDHLHLESYKPNYSEKRV